MNKIVHQHVSASELPEKLRGELPPDARVTVTVEEEPMQPGRPQNLNELFERVDRARAGKVTSSDEAVERIRRLRDEWDS